MKTIDKTLFESVVLSATSSTSAVFDMLQPHFDDVQKTLRRELFGGFDIAAVEGLEDIAVRLVCLRTYYEQIPHLDLVLTPTGFGIVSNENVSPASPERVKALRQQVLDAYDDAFDEAVLAMCGTEWVTTIWGKGRTSSLFITASDLRKYAGMADAHRTALLQQRIRIEEAEEHIRRCISAEFFDVLLSQIREKTLTADNEWLVLMLKLAVGAWLAGNKKVMQMKLETVINTMEAEIDSYPEYRDSNAYKVKHFEYYRNEKDDTTFFFG